MLSLNAVFHTGGTDPTTGAGSTISQGLRQDQEPEPVLECHVLPLGVHWSQDSNPST